MSPDAHQPEPQAPQRFHGDPRPLRKHSHPPTAQLSTSRSRDHPVAAEPPRDAAVRPSAKRVVVALGVALGLTGLAGCTSTSAAPAGSATPSTSPSTIQPSQTTPPAASSPASATPQQRALDAYQAMWAAWVSAAQTSDAHTTTIGRHAAGNALELILTSLAQDKQEGVVTRGDPVLNPRVQTATPPAAPTHVTITDCADASHWLKYRASTGKLKNNVPGGRHAITALVQNVGGTWMVVQFVVQSVGTC